ncbi:MAG: N-methyl-L-tryptophan oxidase [Bacteroidota bacterium]
MATTHDVIVIGVGAMGASACYHLAQRGLRVLGVERHPVGHSLGSSAGDTRIVRRAYFEHPSYVPLLDRAYRLWDHLGDEADQTLFHRTGLAAFGRPTSAVLQGAQASADQYGVQVEPLTHAEARHRFPQVSLPGDFVGLWEPEAGFAWAEPSIRAMARLAQQHGAVIQAPERVTHWAPQGEGVRVTTDQGSYHAAALVLAAGAWTTPLLPPYGLPLSVRRMVLGWVQPLVPQAFALGTFPCWMVDDPERGLYYGFPLLPEVATPGLKVASHVPGPEADPDAVDRTVAPGDEETFRPVLGAYLPQADGPTLATKVCMYTMTPDEHFILDRLPDGPPVWVAAGFSGHGFKFAPVMGEALADLVMDGTTDLPVGFLGLDRFSRLPVPSWSLHGPGGG